MPKPWKCSSTSTLAGIVWAIVDGTYAMARPADDSGVSDTLPSPAPFQPSIGIRHWPSISCANAFQATPLLALLTGAGMPVSFVCPCGSPVCFGSVGVRASAQPACICPGWSISLHNAVDPSEEALGGLVARGPLQIQD